MKKRLNLFLPVFLIVVVAMLSTGACAKQTTIKFAVWDFSMSPEYAMIIEDFERET